MTRIRHPLAVFFGDLDPSVRIRSVGGMNFLTSVAAVGAWALLANAVALDVSNPASVKSAASTVAWELVTWYPGNQTGQTPGLLSGPYYWWEAGAMFGTLIDYWYYTGDTSYNDITTQALLFQASPTEDFMPANQTNDEGNDDQLFWAFAVMSAAELKFPNPPADQPQWLALAQGVFNSQALRWDNTSCNGGLHWQIYQWNNGYGYKNTPANGGFLNLAARLYAYTGNETYADWVVKTWDWMSGIGLIGPAYNIYDGSDDSQNCSSIDHDQWTYNSGIMINAAAVMWNKTQDPMWEDRVNGIWGAAQKTFFENEILYEVECEPQNKCDTDQLRFVLRPATAAKNLIPLTLRFSFKAYFARFVASAAKIAPFLYPTVQPYMVKSSQAAAAQCNGGTNGITCGTKWTTSYDGTYGPGQQMCALEIILFNLIQEAPFPVSATSGGISHGNATFGTGGDNQSPDIKPLPPITLTDRVGAGVVTAVIIIGTVGGGW